MSPGDWTCTILGSDDGQNWTEIGRAADAIPAPPKPVLFGPTGSLVKASVQLAAPSSGRDNFVCLMPGEQRSIEVQVENADTRGETPAIVVDGFNVD